MPPSYPRSWFADLARTLAVRARSNRPRATGRRTPRIVHDYRVGRGRRRGALAVGLNCSRYRLLLEEAHEAEERGEDGRGEGKVEKGDVEHCQYFLDMARVSLID